MIQKVSVAGLIPHSNKILVVRRSPKENFFPGIYELPGGKVDFGESPEKAIVREVYEETGLITSVNKIFDSRSYLSKENTQHNIEIFYLLSLREIPKITLSKEHDKYMWINYDSINNTDLPENDPIRMIIIKYFTNLKGREAN
jgi:8-oxo-dGTP diphosphatase